MSQFQPPSQPPGQPPFGSAAAFGEPAPVDPGSSGGASAAGPAAQYEQVPPSRQPADYGPPAGQAQGQPFGQPQQYPQQYPQQGHDQYAQYAGQYAQYPDQAGPVGNPPHDPYAAPSGHGASGPYSAAGAYAPHRPETGPSIFEDPQRLGRLAWIAVAVFGGLIAVASVLDAIANFAMAGFYSGIGTVFTGLAVLLKGFSLAAVVVTVGKLAIDFFVGAALDRRARADETDGRAAGAEAGADPRPGGPGAPTDPR